MLILQTGTIARHVCLNAGGDAFSRGSAAETNSKILRNFFLSGALGHVYQRVAKFSERKRTDQTAERYLLEFDVTRGEAEGRAIMGGAFPDGFVSILRMRNSSLSRTEKSLLLAGAQGSLGLPLVAKQMLRSFDPCGGPARWDVLTATDWDMDSDEGDSSRDDWAAYRKAKNRQKGSRRGTSNASKGANKIKGDGQILNALNRRTGEHNRCRTRDSENRPAPEGPQRIQGEPVSISSPPTVNTAPRSSFSSISMGNPASACMEGYRNPKGSSGNCEQSISTTSEAGSQLLRMREGRVVISDTGATADLVCLRWLIHHNSRPEKMGRPPGATYPAKARFKFGGGRMGDVRHDADISAAIAGAKGNFTASVFDADIPLLLRQGALGALGEQLVFSRDTHTLGFRGLRIPPKANNMRRYILSVADFDGRRGSRDRVPSFSAPAFRRSGPVPGATEPRQWWNSLTLHG